MDAALRQKVEAAKVLVVGAGGIGCELLKGLVLTGFKQLEVVDLDTIDVSNLNRQFLFRPHHVGRSKAICAAEMVAGFAPGVSIKAHHGNVKEPQFGVPFVAGFDLVINALDNMDARRHVNRLCLAADKPLIEAGTAGYLGQAQTILKGLTACIECQPTPPAKTYPICTIRSTPDKPVHCVVWGKELHKLLLGNAKESYLYDGPGSSGAAASSSSSSSSSSAEAEPAATYMDAVQALPPLDSPTLPAAARAYAEAVFSAIFQVDIERRLQLAPETYKGARVRPRPLHLDKCLAGEYDSSPTPSASASASASAAPLHLLPEQRVLSVQASAALFLDTLGGLVASPASRASFGLTDFSKDSPSCLDLVTSATNLRAAVFAIPLQSRWDVKAIAGSIIPAIATTNAAVAGLQVLEALKLLAGGWGSAGAGAAATAAGRHTYVVREPAGGRKAALLMACTLSPPAPHCPACSTPSLTLHVRDLAQLSLHTLLRQVLQAQLGFAAPNVDNGSGLFFCELNLDEDDEEEFEAGVARLLALPLAQLPGGGVQHGSILGITEMAAGLGATSLNLTVLQGGLGPEAEAAGRGWELRGVRAPMPPPAPAPAPAEEARKGQAAAASAAAAAPAGKKRGRQEAEEAEEEDVVVVVDEEEEGGEEEGHRGKRAKVSEEAEAAAAAAGAAQGPAKVQQEEEEEEIIVVD